MKRFLFLMSAAVTLVCSCAIDDDCQKCKEVQAQVEFGNDPTKTIMFSLGGDLAMTKTDAVSSLSSFNVNAVTGTAGTSETSEFNLTFSKDGATSNYVASPKQYWPSSDPKYKFYASNVAMTPASTGPTVSATNGTDVVCAFNSSPTYGSSNALAFAHIFARIGSCNISAPSDGSTVSSITVSITPKTGGTYNLYTGSGKTDGTGWSSTTTGSAVTIANALSLTTDNGLYLVPGSYDISASYTLSKTGYSKTFNKKASGVAIVGGKINNISATLPNSDAVEISFTVSVAEWTNNNISGVTFK